MNISSLTTIENNSVSNDLLSYLSQVVLTVTDAKIKEENELLKKSKLKLAEIKGQVKSEKNILDKLFLDLSIEKQRKVVLDLIKSLEENGALVGQNKSKILKVVEEIEEKDYETLRNLEQKLSILRPET